MTFSLLVAAVALSAGPSLAQPSSTQEGGLGYVGQDAAGQEPAPQPQPSPFGPLGKVIPGVVPYMEMRMGDLAGAMKNPKDQGLLRALSMLEELSLIHI